MGHDKLEKRHSPQDIVANSDLQALFINADELTYREALASQNRQTLDRLFGELIQKSLPAPPTYEPDY